MNSIALLLVRSNKQKGDAMPSKQNYYSPAITNKVHKTAA